MKKLNKEMFVSPILMWIIVFVGVIIIISFVSNEVFYEKSIFSVVLFILIIIYGLYIFINSFIVHNKAPLSVDKIDKLVTKGVYRIVRHPFYFSEITMGISLFVLFPRIDVLFSIMWLIIVLGYWMSLEERFLIKKFGSEYLEYKKKVPMVIPRVW
ncbi:isoprenylcysteine carboxylmethyltransferase family protein [Candidatus Pacearchaeota archaeon]|nr:isoprenylcysteine carboxylmethyltransferase family protein [Candidatus Pacearchaeota archaeon]